MFDLLRLLWCPTSCSWCTINIFSTGIMAYVFALSLLLLDTVSVNGFLPNSGFRRYTTGEIFFDHNVLMYLAFLLVLVMHVYLYYTTGGLNLRSCGENSKASDSVGIKVVQTRYITTILSSVLASVGGVALSIGNVNTFVEGMSSGKGFIALAALTFGRWSPLGYVGRFLFGLVDAFQLRLQVSIVDAPYQYYQMLPYIVTIIVLV